jgi:L-amino acid N-acyltransferase YncA
MMWLRSPASATGGAAHGVAQGARDAGARQVIAVIADTGSPASVALHRRRGFREVGRLCDVGFKAEQWLDVVMMQALLAGLPLPLP